MPILRSSLYNSIEIDVSAPLPKEWKLAALYGDLAAFLLLYCFDDLAHNPLCGSMFQCGCKFALTWSKAWAKCNVRDDHGPSCPWCSCASFLDGHDCGEGIFSKFYQK